MARIKASLACPLRHHLLDLGNRFREDQPAPLLGLVAADGGDRDFLIPVI